MIILISWFVLGFIAVLLWRSLEGVSIDNYGKLLNCIFIFCTGYLSFIICITIYIALHPILDKKLSWVK